MREDGYGWLKMRETATSLFPHTVSPLATTCLSPRVWRSHYTPPLLPFSVQKRTTTSAVHSPFPSPFTPFSLTPLLCPPFFFSLLLKHMHYFQPWLCRVDRETRTMAAFQSHGPAFWWGGGGPGGHWLQVFFSTVNSNGLMQLAYYWHASPQR